MQSRHWLLIVDTTLQSLDGHSFHYDLAIAEAAKEIFDRVVVYGEAGLSAALADAPVSVQPIPAIPAFGTLRRIAPRKLRKTIRAAEFGLALMRILRAIPVTEVDHVHILVQFDSLAEIAGIDRYAGWWQRFCRGALVLHIVLRHDPLFARQRGERAEKLAERLQRLKTRPRPLVRLYTDSKLLQEKYREFLGGQSRVILLPIPVHLPPAGNERARRKGGELCVSMLGSPRLEKGFALTDRILQALPARVNGTRLCFAVQIVHATGYAEVDQVTANLVRRAQQRSSDLPLLELLEGPASSDTYFEWFRTTDILLAPYVHPRYETSTSGVFVEALHFSVPTITFRRTWVASRIQAAAATGLKLGEIADDVDGIPAAVSRICDNLDRYRSDIATHLTEWRRFNNAVRLAEILRNNG